MIKSARLTPLGIERKKAKTADVWLSDDEGTRGGGRLVIRISPSGSKLFYFRYSIDGVRKQLPIGPYAAEPVEGRYTLDQARHVGRSYSALHRDSKTRDVAAYLQEVEAERLAVIRKGEEDTEKEKIQLGLDSKYSLQALCERYVQHLEDGKKQSAANVKAQLKLYVSPTEWAPLPAKNFTAKQATVLLRKIVESGKGHTSKKIRSFLHSAYALAMRSELDATVSSDLITFGIEVNPISSTSAMSQFNKARERSLTSTEMGEVWKRLWANELEPSLGWRALRLSILLGGQRAQQLLRVRRIQDIDRESEIILIYDGKGRRTIPRQHALPIIGRALDEIDCLIKHSELLGSEWLFPGASKQLGPEAVSDLVHDMSVAFVKEGISKQQFQFSDLRRTAETMMASIGIHKDTRAQVQSHGLGGVQDRHYDRHDYMSEKRVAIRAWQNHLDLLATGKPMPSNVVELKQA
jgi:hypothetical protein